MSERQLKTRTGLLSVPEVLGQHAATTGSNGVRSVTVGRLEGPFSQPSMIDRLVGTVPSTLGAALSRYLYAFVPLAIPEARLEATPTRPEPDDATWIALESTAELTDRATCHRNAHVRGTEVVFFSTRLQRDSFGLAFEFFINVAHNAVESLGLPQAFTDVVWKQAMAAVRGETSIDAWEQRAASFGLTLNDLRSQGTPIPQIEPDASRINEAARLSYLGTAFSDSLAIYLLSLFLDFDYSDLRERDYPLLSPTALGERLRVLNTLFPPNPGYEFAIRYRRRGERG